MKKFISLLLVLILCLSLCSCGKSAAAQAVEDMINAIGEVTAEKAPAIEEAIAAYDALSEKDQEAVENYDILKSAYEDLFYVEFYELANQLLEVYYSAKNITGGVKIIWDNVGSSDFWTTFKAIRMFSEDLSLAEYDAIFREVNGTKAYASIWVAARGLCPSNIYNTNQMTDAGQENTIDQCVAFNKHYDFISINMDVLSESVRVFRNKYEDTFGNEVESLHEFCLELSMFVDFALEPTGSLNSYTAEDRDYQNAIDRLIKILDSYR